MKGKKYVIFFIVNRDRANIKRKLLQGVYKGEKKRCMYKFVTIGRSMYRYGLSK